MLDQSFSYENFRILLDVENRKGNYLEDKKFFDSDIFKDSRKLTDQIIELNASINIEYSKLKNISVKTQQDYEEYDKLIAIKEKLKLERENVREIILSKIGEKTNNDGYKIEICKGQFKYGSQLYNSENKPEHYFVLKQLQRNIYKTFKVKQGDRKSIISQLITLFEDGFPKIIIRTDIKSFYETIPHTKLLSKIDENNLLSYPSKKIIRDILNQYWKILISDGIKTTSDQRQGIPRGIGISAYLSELYMRDFDRKILAYPNVTYYARYVDDIIIIITPSNRNEKKTIPKYKSDIKSLLYSSTGLNINTEKTSIVNLKPSTKTRKVAINYTVNYLGYKFIMGFKRNYNGDETEINKIPLIVLMSDNKFERYQNKITASFNDYLLQKNKYIGQENGVNRMLIRRITFLTHNYRLMRRKSNVIVGIFYTNQFLSSFEDLYKLDRLLANEINRISDPNNILLVEKLRRQSFLKGFKQRLFSEFHYKAFENERTLGIWKNL